MKALTIQGYWAWLIIHGPKRVENRPTPFSYRGELAIHCGKSRVWDAAAVNLCEQLGVELPPAGELHRTAIVGLVDVLDCVPITCDDVADNPWAFGPHCLVLGNVRPLAFPIACRGFQSLWAVPPDVEHEIRRLASPAVASHVPAGALV